jgi:hypothetical protein
MADKSDNFNFKLVVRVINSDHQEKLRTEECIKG